MPAARKTRSGRSAPPPPSKRVRTKGGCLTCRIRRKKCDESRDHNGGCETCARLHIECLGYSTKRPEWLKGTQVNDFKRLIKHFLADHNAKSSTRPHDGDFLWLHNSKTRPAPPQQLVNSDESDSDSDPESQPMPSSSYTYSSPPVLSLDLDSLGLLPDPWPQPDSLTASFGWDSFQSYNTGPYMSPGGSDDAEGSIYLDTMPVLLDLPPMLSTYDYSQSLEHSLADPESFSVEFDHLTMGPYESYNPQRESIYDLYLSVLQHSNAGSLADGLAEALQTDPEGIKAVFDGLSPNCQGDLLERGTNTMLHLWRSGFDKAESRAFACLWLMTGSLSRGEFSLWGNCLDLVLSWVHDVCSPSSSPFNFSDLSATQQLVLRRGIWSDIVAGATTGRQPMHIELYRRVLGSAKSEIMGDCSNKTALAVTEAVALAAHPEQLPRAGTNLDSYRKDLPLADDSSEGEVPSAAAIHTAGGRLYLEVTAHHGAVEHPAVQQAVQAVCKLANKTDQRRDIAFWIFLAGCHTVDSGQWEACESMMSNILYTRDGERTVWAAYDVMKEVYTARQRHDAQPDMWRTRMNELGALLV
ncbi:hypothetical protein FRC12_012957 [Ceratobasidium sp. 428]|nr:hypothetical protein FRC12_012957 [Ceratobasidium sp. 428]